MVRSVKSRTPIKRTLDTNKAGVRAHKLPIKSKLSKSQTTVQTCVKRKQIVNTVPAEKRPKSQAFTNKAVTSKSFSNPKGSFPRSKANKVAEGPKRRRKQTRRAAEAEEMKMQNLKRTGKRKRTPEACLPVARPDTISSRGDAARDRCGQLISMAV